MGNTLAVLLILAGIFMIIVTVNNSWGDIGLLFQRGGFTK